MAFGDREHLLYLGWALAGQACWWSFVFTWTTGFGLLRDNKGPGDKLLWAVGCMFLASAWAKLLEFSKGRGEFVTYLIAGSTFYLSAMLCSVTAGVCSWYYHLGDEEILPDLGFALVAEAPVGSFFRGFSNTLAVSSAVFVLGRQLLFKDTYVVLAWFRCMTICYLLRATSLGLTSLPGPAEHCRNTPGERPYSIDRTGLVPPENHWMLIAGRVGAMYGAEENCGDLIFSGHTAFTITSLLAALSGVSKWPGKYHKLALLAALTYALTFMYMCIAARKHYTVDVWLGFVIAVLVWTNFSQSWIPAFYRS